MENSDIIEFERNLVSYSLEMGRKIVYVEGEEDREYYEFLFKCLNLDHVNCKNSKSVFEDYCKEFGICDIGSYDKYECCTCSISKKKIVNTNSVATVLDILHWFEGVHGIIDNDYGRYSMENFSCIKDKLIITRYYSLESNVLSLCNFKFNYPKFKENLKGEKLLRKNIYKDLYEIKKIDFKKDGIKHNEKYVRCYDEDLIENIKMFDNNYVVDYDYDFIKKIRFKDSSFIGLSQFFISCDLGPKNWKDKFFLKNKCTNIEVFFDKESISNVRTLIN